MLKSDIAIIGIAGRFPDAADVEQLYRNLCEGRESLRPISPARVTACALDPQCHYRAMGYLEDIDRFDYEFFGIPLGEARKLSPHLRLVLEEAWHACESAACPPDRLRGTRTDVYMTQVESLYAELADEDSATLFTGNAPEFIVGRLNRVFDLRGNSVVVDTACSSGLAAILLASDSLRLERADYALVCGTNICLFPYDRPSVLETTAPDGCSRSYALDATGMVAGEAVVCLLLTTVARAEAQGHPIQAVMRGGALNNNGARSSSPSAPHSVMQAQVMRDAWARAGIAPAALGFIEGHGSATRLGDSLEIEAFRMALEDRPREVPPCALSAIKANIGHGKSAAALSSLVKAILSVQRGVRFPAPNARQVNPVLLKADSPIYVNATLVPWPEQTRLAAVHSYGMSGVNCCVVLENYPERPAETVRAGHDAAWLPVAVSASGAAALREHVSSLRQWIETHDGAAFPDIARTLSLGRQHLAHRCLVHATDREGLMHAWEEWLAGSGHEDTAPPASPSHVVLLFSAPDGPHEAKAFAGQLAMRFPLFRRTLDDLVSRVSDDAAFTIACQMALHALFDAIGISGTLVGAGAAGQLTVAALKGTTPVSQALREAAAMDRAPLEDIEARIATLVSRLGEPASTVCVQMGTESIVSRQLRRAHARALRRIEVPGDDAVIAVQEIAARLFREGHPTRFDVWFEGHASRATALPGYRFAPTRCWIRDAPKPRVTVGAAADVNDQREERWGHASYVERRLGEIWREQLGRDGFGPDDDVFALGADSLMVTRVVRQVNQALGVRCDFEDVFDYPTVAGLARVVRSQCSVLQLVCAMWREVLHVETVREHDDFFVLGGHSLLANEIMLRARLEFGIVLSFDDFFGVPTPSAFARAVDERVRSDTPGEAPAAAPLTPEAWSAILERRELH